MALSPTAQRENGRASHGPCISLINRLFNSGREIGSKFGSRQSATCLCATATYYSMQPMLSQVARRRGFLRPLCIR